MVDKGLVPLTDAQCRSRGSNRRDVITLLIDAGADETILGDYKHSHPRRSADMLPIPPWQKLREAFNGVEEGKNRGLSSDSYGNDLWMHLHETLEEHRRFTNKTIDVHAEWDLVKKIVFEKIPPSNVPETELSSEEVGRSVLGDAQTRAQNPSLEEEEEEEKENLQYSTAAEDDHPQHLWNLVRAHVMQKNGRLHQNEILQMPEGHANESFEANQKSGSNLCIVKQKHKLDLDLLKGAAKDIYADQRQEAETVMKKESIIDTHSKDRVAATEQDKSSSTNERSESVSSSIGGEGQSDRLKNIEMPWARLRKEMHRIHMHSKYINDELVTAKLRPNVDVENPSGVDQTSLSENAVKPGDLPVISRSTLVEGKEKVAEKQQENGNVSNFEPSAPSVPRPTSSSVRSQSFRLGATTAPLRPHSPDQIEDEHEDDHCEKNPALRALRTLFVAYHGRLGKAKKIEKKDTEAEVEDKSEPESRQEEEVAPPPPDAFKKTRMQAHYFSRR